MDLAINRLIIITDQRDPGINRLIIITDPRDLGINNLHILEDPMLSQAVKEMLHQLEIKVNQLFHIDSSPDNI